MNLESAILMAIALAFALHVKVYPTTVSDNWLTYLAAHPVLCTDVEMGRPCDDPLAAHDGKGAPWT
jgi:hypothetical protein